MLSPMLASEVDLGMTVTLKSVTDITSAPQQNKLLDGQYVSKWLDCHWLCNRNHQTQSHMLASERNPSMDVTFNGVSDIGCAT